MSDSTDEKVFCNNCKYFVPCNEKFGTGKCTVEESPGSFTSFINYYYTPRSCERYKRRIFPAYDVDVPFSEAQIKSIADRKWLRDLKKYNVSNGYAYSVSNGFYPVIISY